jgi:hypothetical protein
MERVLFFPLEILKQSDFLEGVCVDAVNIKVDAKEMEW